MKNLFIGQIIFPLLLIKLHKKFQVNWNCLKRKRKQFNSYILRGHVMYGTFWGINGSKKFFQDNFQAKTVMVP